MGWFTTRRAVVLSLYIVFFVPLWIVLPAMNEYIIARRCLAMHGVWGTTGQICGGTDVSASAADWFNYVMVACNAPSMIVALPLGQLADARGRRPVLLWCLLTQLVGSAGMLAVCLFQLDLAWLVPTYLVNGLGGGSYILQVRLMSNACPAHVLTPASSDACVSCRAR